MLQFLVTLQVLAGTAADRVKRSGDDSGATAVEYGLMVAAIAAVIIVAVFALGSHISGLFTSTCAKINGGTTCATTP